MRRSEVHPRYLRIGNPGLVIRRRALPKKDDLLKSAFVAPERMEDETDELIQPRMHSRPLKGRPDTESDMIMI